MTYIIFHTIEKYKIKCAHFNAFYFLDKMRAFLRIMLLKWTHASTLTTVSNELKHSLWWSNVLGNLLLLLEYFAYFTQSIVSIDLTYKIQINKRETILSSLRVVDTAHVNILTEWVGL